MESSKYINFLKNLDIFSSPLHFKLANREAVPTKFSLPLSLIISSLTAIVIFFKLNEFFTTDKVLVNIKEENIDPTNIPELNLDYFFFSVVFGKFYTPSKGVLHPNLTDSHMAETRFDIKRAVAEDLKTSPFLPCNQIESFKQGKDAKVIKQIKSIGQEQYLHKFICLNDSEPFRFGGDMFSLGYKHFVTGQINFDLCGDLSEECSKREPTVIQMGLIHNNNLPNMGVYEGFTEQPKISNFNIDLFKDYEIRLYFKKNILVSDNNLIFDFFDKKVSEFLTIREISMVQLADRQDKSHSKLNIYMELDDTVTVYNRSYFKFDDTLADIEGSSKLLFLLVNLPFLVLSRDEHRFLVIEELVETKVYKPVLPGNKGEFSKKRKLDSFCLNWCKYDRKKKRELISQFGAQFERDIDIVHLFRRLYALENKGNTVSQDISSNSSRLKYSERDKLALKDNKTTVMDNFIVK